MKVYYLVYKLTNLVNGKIYIGCHMTKNLDDGYMGSGKLIGYAKKKYGIENFKKEILSTHETPEEMLIEEARLVDKEFLGREDVYNLTCGGRGSWFLVNSNGASVKNFKNKKAQFKNREHLRIKYQTNLEFQKHFRKCQSERAKGNSVWLGKNHSEESKQKISESITGKQTGSLNSQFGTIWIFNEDQKRSLKIKSDAKIEYLDQGWKLGRKLSFNS